MTYDYFIKQTFKQGGRIRADEGSVPGSFINMFILFVLVHQPVGP
jgi:hypothetical protein